LKPEKKVGLVCPPYGPAGLPALGIEILAAGVRSRRADCRVFYWNLELIRNVNRIFGPKACKIEALLKIYWLASNRGWFPFNEWAFTQALYGKNEPKSDALFVMRVSEQAERRKTIERDALRVGRFLQTIRKNAGVLIETMADRLAPFDVVGIGSSFFQNIPALALAKKVKSRWPEKFIVLGGANCDGGMGRQLMELFGFLDFVFTGECDHSFADFIQLEFKNCEFERIPGLVYRDRSGVVQSNPSAPHCRTLDGLPIPSFDTYVAARKALRLPRQWSLSLSLESSRGCWWGEKHHCTFCGLNASAMTYRQKSPNRFIAEVESMVLRYRPRFIFMTDNILPPHYIERLANWVEDRGYDLQFFYETKAGLRRCDVVDLARAGISFIQPGIESFSSKLLSAMRKGTTGIQNIALLKYAREYGIRVLYNILYGFPKEKASDYKSFIAELPKLSHLQPPETVQKVEIHRFSPHHGNPGAFGLCLKPSWKYSCLYPFAQTVVNELAYFFEDRSPVGRSIDPGLLKQEVAQWKKAYHPDVCQLIWHQDGPDIIIEDKRNGFPKRTYRLQHHAAALFEEMDKPRRLRYLLDCDPIEHRSSVNLSPSPLPEATIRFSQEEFSADWHSCMNSLTKPGLVYQEGDIYLALAVPNNFKPHAPERFLIGL